jgi:hypothetical protein
MRYTFEEEEPENPEETEEEEFEEDEWWNSFINFFIPFFLKFSGCLCIGAGDSLVKPLKVSVLYS